ncbi:MAG: tail fiber domain-containing protein, partial [Pseudobdellovibrionaceae bacterium]
STHQATLAVLSPDESNVLGLSFDGSNTTGYLKTTSTDLGLVVNNTTEAIHMTSAGNVGIGTTAPTAALQVESNTTSTPQLVVKQNNNADWARITMNANGNSWLLSVGAPGTGQSDLFNIYSTTLSANVISATATGNVGINTNNPQYTLDVNGSARATGSIAAWSDIRVKKNIQPLDNSLDRILNLKGVSFEWRHDEFPDKKFKEGRDIGVIAQNVETQFPEIVETGKDGYKSVAYQKLVAPLIEAVKTLYSRIMGIERYQTTQDGEIASIKAQKADKVELETIKAENALLKANDVAKDQKIHKLERENAIIKAYLCGKDQNATFCR